MKSSWEDLKQICDPISINFFVHCSDGKEHFCGPIVDVFLTQIDFFPVKKICPINPEKQLSAQRNAFCGFGTDFHFNNILFRLFIFN